MMFTGIIEEVGTVAEFTYTGSGPENESLDAVLRICAPALTPNLGSGQSISVDGICLTLTEDPAGEVFRVDVMPPTLQRTALRRLRRGCGV
ncbi:MAG TPA: riboflavin synthase, partial [Beutenbergiaceae bacterium]|nr:riboflavin synthase [Beutenbergiaceae bacterium]